MNDNGDWVSDYLPDDVDGVLAMMRDGSIVRTHMHPGTGLMLIIEDLRNRRTYSLLPSNVRGAQLTESDVGVRIRFVADHGRHECGRVLLACRHTLNATALARLEAKIADEAIVIHKRVNARWQRQVEKESAAADDAASAASPPADRPVAPTVAARAPPPLPPPNTADEYPDLAAAASSTTPPPPPSTAGDVASSGGARSRRRNKKRAAAVAEGDDVAAAASTAPLLPKAPEGELAAASPSDGDVATVAFADAAAAVTPSAPVAPSAPPPPSPPPLRVTSLRSGGGVPPPIFYGADGPYVYTPLLPSALLSAPCTPSTPHALSPSRAAATWHGAAPTTTTACDVFAPPPPPPPLPHADVFATTQAQAAFIGTSTADVIRVLMARVAVLERQTAAQAQALVTQYARLHRLEMAAAATSAPQSGSATPV